MVTAAGLTGLVVLLFLGSWRATVIIATSIPLSILSALICLHWLGESINIMTLGGLALAVGILVDDATVMIENIDTHIEMGKPIENAITDAANQILVPTFVATLCIMVVWLPLFGLSGVSGWLFAPMAEAVMFAMGASFILSRTLVPTMAKYMLAGHAHGPGEHGAHEGEHGAAEAHGEGHDGGDAHGEHGHGEHGHGDTATASRPRRARPRPRGSEEQQHLRPFPAGLRARASTPSATTTAMLLTAASSAAREVFIPIFLGDHDRVAGALLLQRARLLPGDPVGHPADAHAGPARHPYRGLRPHRLAGRRGTSSELLPGKVEGVVSNCGLPVGPHNLAFIPTPTIGTQDCDLTISLRNETVARVGLPRRSSAEA